MAERTEVTSYLTERERLLPAEVEHWLENAWLAPRTTRQLPDAVRIDRAADAFHAIARQVGRFPVFANLPEEEIEQVSDRLVHARYEHGHAFFQAGEEADRLFILQHGEVELLDPRTSADAEADHGRPGVRGSLHRHRRGPHRHGRVPHPLHGLGPAPRGFR